ncbi:hypothetical protein M9Y10_042230 [Tritrichomonas musculus]|uniref:Serine-threonine/tyrosine-protein kinase catalytic domain-containing protein n=1 Tax=Tritrichomonas musculus TaxID=1915356 RepID=A0ABR2K7J9_9EUKA
MKDKADGKPIKFPVQSELITKDCIDLIAKCLDYNQKSRPSFEILKYLKEHNYMIANDVDPTIVSQRDNELESIESQ